MRVVTSAEFALAFDRAARESDLSGSAVANWEWLGHTIERADGLPRLQPTSTANFTALVEDRVVPRIAELLRLRVELRHRVSRDDGRGCVLDAVFFDVESGVPVIAWEHENDIRNTVEDEVVNLRSVDTPLKVLVTCLRPFGDDNADEWLRRYARAYADGPEGRQATGEFTVIFGLPDGQWSFHEYTGVASEANGFRTKVV